MADFNYIAVDKNGREKRGNIIADNLELAYEQIRSTGMIPVEVKAANVMTKDINISLGPQVKPRDLSVFCRQFISMVSAGVTIIDAFSMLEEQTENKAMAKAMGGVRVEIGKGETLATAMGKFPKIFPSIMVSMVAAGEASGKLEVAFERMAVHFEKSAKLKSMIRKAAVYPIIVGLVALAVVIVMLVKVIPAYSDTFEQLGADLPGITKAVVAISNGLIRYWYLVAAVVIGTVVGINMFRKTETGQVFFGRLSRTMPIFGKLTIKTAAASFARTLSTLIYSGLPMVEALAITANTMTNYLYKQKLLECREEVTRGVPLSEPLLRDDLFPPMVGHMAKIGEETGDIENMLNKLADYYDEEVEMTTQTVMAALEPMIILVLAAIVGVLIASVMSPMLAMYQNMDSL